MAKIKPSARPSASRPSASRPSASAASDLPPVKTPRARIVAEADDLVFGTQTFLWIGIGIALMILGMILMAGGGMPDPEVWDDDLIYSFRRITLAPIVIIAGLGVITYAILKK